MTELHADGRPLLPDGIHAKWRNRCGVVVRDMCRISYINWNAVPGTTKEEMWNEVKKAIRFKDEHLQRAEKASLEEMGNIFKNWKSKLNCDFVKMNKTPFSKYGKISPDDWETFVSQKTSPEAIALSEKMAELNRKNKFKVHLGPGGYRKKVGKWRAREEKNRALGIPDPLEGLEERSRNWVYARSDVTDEGQLVLKDPASSEVVEKLKDTVKQQEQGLFQPEYHRDQLTKALGTKEKGGRVRGVSSSASWKEGFSDPPAYRKRDLHKKDLREEGKWEFRRQFQQLVEERIKGTLDPVTQAALDALSGGTSTGSINGPPPQEPEEIKEPTPCELHLPFGYKGKTKKVATGTAMPGRRIHNRDVPPGYVVVSVAEVATGHEDDEIEHPIPEAGIETLQQARGSFIMWKRSDVILSTSAVSPTPKSGHGSFHASQPSTDKPGQPSPNISGAASGTRNEIEDAVYSPPCVEVQMEEEPLVQCHQDPPQVPEPEKRRVACPPAAKRRAACPPAAKRRCACPTTTNRKAAHNPQDG